MILSSVDSSVASLRRPESNRIAVLRAVCRGSQSLVSIIETTSLTERDVRTALAYLRRARLVALREKRHGGGWVTTLPRRTEERMVSDLREHMESRL